MATFLLRSDAMNLYQIAHFCVHQLRAGSVQAGVFVALLALAARSGVMLAHSVITAVQAGGVSLVDVALIGESVVVLGLIVLAGLMAGRLARTQREVAARDVAVQALEEDRRVRRQSEERFRSLVLNTSDVITILTETGEIDYYSPSANRIWGYSADALRS